MQNNRCSIFVTKRWNESSETTKKWSLHWHGCMITELIIWGVVPSLFYSFWHSWRCLKYTPSLHHTGPNSQTTNWTETMKWAGIKTSLGLLRSASVRPSSFGAGKFHSVTAFVSFGVSMLNSTRGNVQCITPSVCLAAKDNIQWEVSPCGRGEDICVDDWTVRSGSGRVRTQNFPYGPPSRVHRWLRSSRWKR